MRQLLLLLCLTTSTTVFAADVCAPYTARVIEGTQFREVVDTADLIAAGICDATLIDRFETAKQKFEYVAVEDVVQTAAAKSIVWNRPTCPASPCELYVRVASLPPALQDAVLRDVKPSRSPAAGSGGLPSIPDHYLLSMFARHVSSVAGHYDITMQGIDRYIAATGEPFSQEATLVLADASRDPDFFEWNSPAAHAQTKSDDSAELVWTKAVAQKNFRDWEKNAVHLVATACGAKDIRTALYRAGYALHGVQDLAFHNGISNAEHAWRDYGDAPDEQGVDTNYLFASKSDLATNGTVVFLSKIRLELYQLGYAKCWSRMLAYTGRPPTNAEKKALHAAPPDISVAELYRYRALAKPFASGSAAQPTKYFVSPRWLHGNAGDFDPAVYAAILNSLLRPE